MPDLQFFSKPFDTIDEADLIDLVDTKKVREHLQLDYKLTAYNHNRDGSIEMLADITSMANARGGYIILGVEEDGDPAQPDGTPRQIVGLVGGDQEANWSIGVCTSSIDEKIVGLRVRDIPLANGRSCVLIYVPNSLRKPHMIKYQSHYSFRVRNERSKRFLDMPEIRSMILSAYSYRESLNRFLQERKQALTAFAAGAPWCALMVTPIYVDLDKIDPIGNEQIRDILRNPPAPVDANYVGIYASRRSSLKPRLYGVETTNPDEPNAQPKREVVRLFRNGHFEHWEVASENLRANDDAPIDLYAYRVAVVLINVLETAQRLIHAGAITERLALTAHWQNVANSRLRRGDRYEGPWERGTNWSDETLTLSMIITMLDEPRRSAREILDLLFNAYGFESCPYFNNAGGFQVQR